MKALPRELQAGEDVAPRVRAQPALAWLSVAAWMIMIFVFSALPSVSTPLEGAYEFTLKKFAHVGEYAVLAALLFRALQIHIKHLPRSLTFTVLTAILFAASDEWHQTFVPGREGTLRDIGIDALGIAAVVLWLHFARRYSSR